MAVIPGQGDLAAWTFEVDEVSAGVYDVRARDDEGRVIELKGFDPEELLERCMTLAREARPG